MKQPNLSVMKFQTKYCGFIKIQGYYNFDKYNENQFQDT